ncbi:unnamed protein product, partial [Adineta steineri]
RHHPIPVPDHVTKTDHTQGTKKKLTELIEANTSTHTENHSNNKTATSSSGQIANQTTK